METNTAFVGTNGVVMLNAVAHVGLHLTLIISPSDAELNHSVGNAEALYQIIFFKLGVFVVLFFDGGEHLAHCLDVLRLIGESSFQFLYNFISFHVLFLVIC